MGVFDQAEKLEQSNAKSLTAPSGGSVFDQAEAEEKTSGSSSWGNKLAQPSPSTDIGPLAPPPMAQPKTPMSLDPVDMQHPIALGLANDYATIGQEMKKTKDQLDTLVRSAPGRVDDWVKNVSKVLHGGPAPADEFTEAGDTSQDALSVTRRGLERAYGMKSLGSPVEGAVPQMVEGTVGQLVDIAKPTFESIFGAKDDQGNPIETPPLDESVSRSLARAGIAYGTGKLLGGEESPTPASAPGPAAEEDSIRHLRQAIRPMDKNRMFAQNVRNAWPHLVEQFGDSLPTSLEDLRQAAVAAKRRIWDRVSQNYAATGGVKVNTEPIYNAMASSIDQRTYEQNPQLYRNILSKANASYRQPVPGKPGSFTGRWMDLGDLEDRLQAVNNEQRAAYAKYPFDQAAAERDPAHAATFAEGKFLRRLLYANVPENSGLKKAYGSLESLNRDISKRQIIAERQAPFNLQQSVNIPVAIAHAIRHPVGAAAQVAGSALLKNANDPDTLVQNAFAAKSASSVPTALRSVLAGSAAQAGVANVNASPMPTSTQPTLPPALRRVIQASRRWQTNNEEGDSYAGQQ